MALLVFAGTMPVNVWTIQQAAQQERTLSFNAMVYLVNIEDLRRFVPAPLSLAAPAVVYAVVNLAYLWVTFWLMRGRAWWLGIIMLLAYLASVFWPFDAARLNIV